MKNLLLIIFLFISDASFGDTIEKIITQNGVNLDGGSVKLEIKYENDSIYQTYWIDYRIESKSKGTVYLNSLPVGGGSIKLSESDTNNFVESILTYIRKNIEVLLKSEKPFTYGINKSGKVIVHPNTEYHRLVRALAKVLGPSANKSLHLNF